jgi:hypothetical protein
MSLKVDELCRSGRMWARKTAPLAVTVGRSYLCFDLRLSEKVQFLSKT